MSLKLAIQNLANTGDEVYGKIGTVGKVDVSAKTCTIELLSGEADILNVRYVTDISAKLIATPLEGALALIVFLSQETAMLVWASEYESLEIQVGNSVFNIKEKFAFNNASTSLKDILNDFVDKVKNLVLDTPSGPGAINAASKTQLDLTKQTITQLFE